MILRSAADDPTQLPRALAFLRAHWPAYVWKGRPVDPRVSFDGAVGSQPDWQLAWFDDDVMVATFHGVTVTWSEPTHDGWDRALRTADPAGTTLIGLAITIDTSRRGEGLSGRVLGEVKARARARGLKHLRIPVRPNHKSRSPHESMDEYLQHKRPDGLSTDPWVRTHQRQGGIILGSADRSMQIHATRDEWESWCGRPMDDQRWLPGLLAPLTPEMVYEEPNVWLDHPLS